MADQLGVRRSTAKDKLKAAITNALAFGNMVEAKRKQDQLDRKLGLERVKRREKKLRKNRLKQCMVCIDARSCGFDLNSDD